ncbi:MAG: hypothetical protein IPH08_04090 [Rhodocyclaceae bacterium]|nr:hypothetical protein [Rhodocyclaceae bacterium]
MGTYLVFAGDNHYDKAGGWDDLKRTMFNDSEAKEFCRGYVTDSGTRWAHIVYLPTGNIIWRSSEEVM